MRAKSDSHAGSRPATPSISGRGRSPSLQPPISAASLSPYDDNSVSSRSSSPARGRNGSITSRNGRSSSNASDQRDYILDLANPERTPSNGADSRRQQKHPATFQCNLCPKRLHVSTIASATKVFTRAKRSSFVEETCRLVQAGVVGVGSLVQTLWADTSDRKPDESASNPCLTRKPPRDGKHGLKSSNRHKLLQVWWRRHLRARSQIST
jgi:hypothetical protein